MKAPVLPSKLTFISTSPLNLTASSAGTGRYAEKSDPLALIFLSINEDTFVTIIYLRHGSHQYNGMSSRDWRIFLSSLAVANIYWTLAAYMWVSLVEWRWFIIYKPSG